MAHFAKIEEGIVTQVVVVDNEHEAYGEEYLHGLGLEGTWIQTSYNSNFRRKYAGIGDTYDEEADAFKSPQPFASWTFNETDWVWEAPVPMPTDGALYTWDEDTTSWVTPE